MSSQPIAKSAASDPVLRAFLLGLSAGSRSMTPNTVLALRQPARAARWMHWVPYRWRIRRAVLVAGMFGEFVGDKLPQTPSRLQPGSLAGRIASGMLAGAAIGSDGAKSGITTGAVLGAVGAVAGSFGGYWVRKTIVERSSPPGLPIALLEDCAAVGLATIATVPRIA
ncbi:MAG: hypothetical protein QM589_09750 [Thermomicrobiales bacterium]